MREMKDSGIEWIGEIPKEWEIIRLCYLIDGYKAGPFGSTLIMDKLDDEGEILVYTPETISTRDTELSTNKYLPDNRRQEMQQFFVEPGDIIFPIVGSLGRAMLIEKGMPEGIINQRLAKFHLSSSTITYPYFMRLFGQSSFFETYIEISCRGSIIVNLTKAILHDMPVPIPPIKDQERISNFLDKRCKEIEMATADIQSQIDTLEQYKRSVITEAVTKGLDRDAEMKESGIEYVGKIPASWDMHPVYYYFGERKHKNSLGEEQNLLSLSYGNIILKDINTREGLLPESFNTYNIVEAGDIIIRPTDLQNDKRSLRTGLVREHGIITSAYIDLMPVRNINTEYYHYLLHAFDVMKVFYNMGNGVRQGLNFSEFSRLMVFEPSLAEQNSIVDYLNDKCGQINTVISEKQDQLATLDAYKKSTIYEYVTGKKKVPAV